MGMWWGPRSPISLLSQVSETDFPAIAVEFALFWDQIENEAKLNSNSFADNQHAIVALPYTTLFATEDKKLSKRITRSQANLRFSTARAITMEQFDILISKGVLESVDR